MALWRFSLVIDGPDVDQSSDLLDQLFEAGCGDALFGGANGVQTAAFHREALTIESAVFSAIFDVETVAGLRVVALMPPDTVTIGDIAVRSGRPLAEIQALMRESASASPEPVGDPSAYEPVWRWCEVSKWLEGSRPFSDASAMRFANLMSFVATRSNLLRLLDALPEELRQSLGPWIRRGGTRSITEAAPVSAGL